MTRQMHCNTVTKKIQFKTITIQIEKGVNKKKSDKNNYVTDMVKLRSHALGLSEKYLRMFLARIP